MDATMFNLLVKIILMAAVGYIMRKSGLMDDVFARNISDLLLMVVIPLNIIAVGNSRYDPALAQGLLIITAMTAGYFTLIYLLMWFSTRRLPLQPNQKGSFVNLVALGNFGYIGLPIITEVLGLEGALYTIIVNLGFQLVAYTLGMRIAGDKTIGLRSIFTSPATLAPILAILLFVSPFRLPGALVGTLEAVGAMSAPISMFIIGGSLAKIKLRSLVTSGWAWLVPLLRQVVIPLAMAGLCLLFGIGGVVAATCVIIFSMPSATVNVIFSERYGLDVPFATRGVVLSTAFMVVSLPLTTLLATRLFL